MIKKKARSSLTKHQLRFFPVGDSRHYWYASSHSFSFSWSFIHQSQFLFTSRGATFGHNLPLFWPCIYFYSWSRWGPCRNPWVEVTNDAWAPASLSFERLPCSTDAWFPWSEFLRKTTTSKTAKGKTGREEKRIQINIQSFTKQQQSHKWNNLTLRTSHKHLSWPVKHFTADADGQWPISH